MSSIIPISTSRVSDLLVRTRLTQQVQNDQLDLFRIQQQLSTGQRIFLPSDDAPSALRAITLQRNLERQTQLQLNLSATQLTLSSADRALNDASSTLISIRGAAIGVSGTDATDEQRQSVIEDIDQAIDQLLQFGNSQSLDNFLFGGSFDGGAPFIETDQFVEYLGNEQTLQAFVDTNLLFDTNVTGQETFGGISDAVFGTSGLSPQLTPNTLLSQLNGGVGASLEGAISIGFVPDDPGGEITETTTLDLRAANTVGDAIRLIEEGAPPSANLRVSIVGDRLEVRTSGPTPGGVIISEIGQGQSATELGINTNDPSATFEGRTLDPTIRLTTPLDSLLGSRSQARLFSAGVNNDLIITANQNGASVDPNDPSSNALNGVVVQFVDGGEGATVGAVYDAGGPGDPLALPDPILATPPTLTVTIESGVTTAAEVADAINAEANGLFTAQVDPADTVDPNDAGQGAIELAATATTFGGSGETLDLAAGIQIENGEGPVVIDTSTAETVFDLLETLNLPSLGLVAELNDTQTGIDVRTRRSGADFAIGENGGTLATQLGLRTFTGESRLEDFNRGIGVTVPGENPEDFAVQNVLRIEITDEGTTQVFEIDLSESVNAEGQVTGVATVDDLFARIASETGGAVQAELAAVGNGIVLSGTNAEVSTGFAPASGSATLAGDTLVFDATTASFEGNQTFSLEVVDSGPDPDGLSVDVTSGAGVENVIRVDLRGATPTTDAIAAAIEAQLTGFTVTSSGAPPATVTAAEPAVEFATSGGVGASAAGADSITVSGSVAERLGFFATDADPAEAASVNGQVSTVDDRNTLEVDSAFNTLLRLRDALERNDTPAIGEALARLEDDIDRVVFAQAEVGARVQTLNILEARLTDEEIEIRSALSDEIDVDLAEAISDFTARQFALQASLQTTASLLQLTVLDFI